MNERVVSQSTRESDSSIVQVIKQKKLTIVWTEDQSKDSSKSEDANKVKRCRAHPVTRYANVTRVAYELNRP